MHDILPDEMRWHTFVRETVAEIAEAYGFGHIETPILEQEEVFIKAVGAATDIVEKQMYTFRTKGGDRVALRPEATAAVVRAYREDGMKSWPQPVRLWYFGPMFRYERPQAGRYRQFWQAGFEVVGEDEAVADAEIVLMTMAVFSGLGLKNLTLQVNSIGCGQCRPVYRKAFVAYLRPHRAGLCANCRRRFGRNPLRVLDCKDERCQRAIQNAPEILDYLCEACRVHFRSFLEFLEELSLPYLLNTHLMRGLDYYSRTVFEIWPEGIDEENAPAQAALASGGRYDNLFKIFTRKPLGAVGVAIGVERVVEALKMTGVAEPQPLQVQVFLVQLGEQAKREALALYEKLRLSRFRVRASFGRDSIKSQLRIADKIGVSHVLILGQKEVADGTIIIRSMADGSQETVKREKLFPTLRNKLRKASTKKKKAPARKSG